MRITHKRFEQLNTIAERIESLTSTLEPLLFRLVANPELQKDSRDLLLLRIRGRISEISRMRAQLSEIISAQLN